MNAENFQQMNFAGLRKSWKSKNWAAGFKRIMNEKAHEKTVLYSGKLSLPSKMLNRAIKIHSNVLYLKMQFSDPPYVSKF